MPSTSSTQHLPYSSKPALGPYKPTLILHGGAGSITRDNLPPSLYAKYRASLLAYLSSTRTLLEAGGTAVAGVCHAVSCMEDDPLFNCGRGSVFTLDGEVEMEASLAVTCIDPETKFEGMVKKSAAVSMLRRTRHPILLAREVLGMGDGDLIGTSEMHGHLSGQNVEEWGWARGLERKEKDWFWTKRRWEEHKRGLSTEGVRNDVCADDEDNKVFEDELADLEGIIELPSQGTVGTVCMDSWGVIAVATSTGGLTNKRPGRIGDTPTVGAGFWAESWVEEIKQESERHLLDTSRREAMSYSERLAARARAEMSFWMGDCLSTAQPSELYVYPQQQKNATNEKESQVLSTPQMVWGISDSNQRRAVAMSGTGNGDSFLRMNACRTTAAMTRFSSSSVSLAIAVHAVAGPEGELQKSASDRWRKAGEGEGGIIGIEMVRGTTMEARTVFDFNCGGLWRAYYEKDDEENEKPVIMVFREDY